TASIFTSELLYDFLPTTSHLNRGTGQLQRIRYAAPRRLSALRRALGTRRKGNGRSLFCPYGQLVSTRITKVESAPARERERLSRHVATRSVNGGQARI